MAQFATVVSITGVGTVFAINAQGASRALKVGDTLQKDEIIRTAGDAHVELLMQDGGMLAVAPAQSVRLDDNVTESDQRPTAQDSAVATVATTGVIIDALTRGTDINESIEPTAAGLTVAGTDNSGSNFVRLLRITEGLTASYESTTTHLQSDRGEGQQHEGEGNRPHRGDTTATLAPTVTITEDTNNNGTISASEISGTVGVKVDIPA
ncbi:MAG: hypothetical protein RL302_992, partial [Pseudomonadota bacterium]